MTPKTFLIDVNLLALLIAITCWQCWRAIQRTGRIRREMKKKLEIVIHLHAKRREFLMQKYDDLQLQLEKVEASWGDAQADLQYKDKQITDLCQHYKKLDIRYKDLQVNYDHLVGRYNCLLSKMPADSAYMESVTKQQSPTEGA